MGKKKRKASSLNNSSSFVSDDLSSSFLDEIIQHLQLFREAGGLVVGCNAVLRALEKNSLSIVIFISRRGTSPMYHALNLMCKGSDARFFQCPEINFGLLNLQIPASTSYGIKTNVIHLPKFSRLLEKINSAKKSHKKNSTEPSKNEKLCLQVKTGSPETENTLLKSESQVTKVKDFIHAMHERKCIGKGKGFLDLYDFPNYKKNSNGTYISIT